MVFVPIVIQPALSNGDAIPSSNIGLDKLLQLGIIRPPEMTKVIVFVVVFLVKGAERIAGMDTNGTS